MLKVTKARLIRILIVPRGLDMFAHIDAGAVIITSKLSICSSPWDFWSSIESIVLCIAFAIDSNEMCRSVQTTFDVFRSLGSHLPLEHEQRRKHANISLARNLLLAAQCERDSSSGGFSPARFNKLTANYEALLRVLEYAIR